MMGRMKEKNLHYLVATDIAARGIDISDLSHVINYTFPESAEVYVHRTGRTGRAGKSGLAISLISPRELGNFYMLKLTYKIKPEERTLPSDAEQKTARESEKVDELRAKVGTREPAAEWRALAKRVWAADDGERLVAALIEDKLSGKSEPPRGPRVLERARRRRTRRRSRRRRARRRRSWSRVPSAGPTGGFSAPPPAQKCGSAQPAARRRPKATTTRSVRVAGAAGVAARAGWRARASRRGAAAARRAASHGRDHRQLRRQGILGGVGRLEVRRAGR